MIAPREIRLVAARDLRGFQRAIAASALHPDPWITRATSVIVPTRSAAAELRTTLENRLLIDGQTSPGAIVLPEFLTRADWYEAMRAALPTPEAPLSSLERQVLMEKAARGAIHSGLRPPFRLRPGLLVEILEFYDALVRHGRAVDRFERLVLADLLPRVDMDRGAARLLDQTRFLVASFRAFEQHVLASGRIDEHLLRSRLLAGGARSPFSHIVVSVGDRFADTEGLWRVDLDLLARLDGIERVDIVATEATLACGLLERLRDEFPGLDETKAADEDEATRAASGTTLLAPAVEQGAGWPGDKGRERGAALYWTARDREDELTDVARRIKAAAPERLERVGVVFGRKLPYLYLARTVFEAAGIEHQLLDALPLAAEPYAAAVDLVFEFALSAFRPSDGMALLASPHFAFTVDGGSGANRESAALLLRLLESRGFPDEPASLVRIARDDEADRVGFRTRLNAEERASALTAGRVLLGLARELEPLTERLPASRQLGTLIEFLVSHGEVPAPSEPRSEPTARCRVAILGAISELQAAYRLHFDPPVAIADLAPALRRWVEGQTFTPAQGRCGIHLIDAVSARYGDFDTLHVVGLVEGEWPPREPPNIFYPPFLLKELGWHSEHARSDALRAAFFDLVALAPRVSFSAFTLEDDAIVEPSALVEDLNGAGLKVERQSGEWRGRISQDEALSRLPVRLDVVRGPAAEWAALRAERTPRADAAFHGRALPSPRRSYPVRAVEEYVKCPFRYFAREVIGLQEPGDENSSAARARGIFLHDVLHDVYEEWQRSGSGAITAGNLAEARDRFRALVQESLASAPARDRPLLEVRLLGSPARAGVIDMLGGIEVERNVAVVERLLELRLDGACEMTREAGTTRSLNVSGVADRIDLLADGTFDLLDYKLGRAPNVRHTVQLPVYSIQAATALSGRHGIDWKVRDAAYVPFAGPERLVTLRVAGKGVAPALAAGQQRFLAAVDGIEAGRFPPRPADPAYCSTCAYASVCRKDYHSGD